MKSIHSTLGKDHHHKAIKLSQSGRLTAVAMLFVVLMLPLTSFGFGGSDSGIEETLERKSPRFWVVNFGTARTLAPGKISFAAGLGGRWYLSGSQEPLTLSLPFCMLASGSACPKSLI